MGEWDLAKTVSTLLWPARNGSWPANWPIPRSWVQLGVHSRIPGHIIQHYIPRLYMGLWGCLENIPSTDASSFSQLFDGSLVLGALRRINLSYIACFIMFYPKTSQDIFHDILIKWRDNVIPPELVGWYHHFIPFSINQCCINGWIVIPKKIPQKIEPDSDLTFLNTILETLFWWVSYNTFWYFNSLLLSGIYVQEKIYTYI